MMTLRFRGRIAAWLALAGIALNAFWPLIANAKPADSPVFAPICSVTGLKHGSSPADVPGENPLSLRCALCVFHAGLGVAITPTAPAPVVPADAVDERPAPIAELRFGTALYLAAPPRAPPFPS
jgi:Protein of unknown function (DUF2946)